MYMFMYLDDGIKSIINIIHQQKNPHTLTLQMENQNQFGGQAFPDISTISNHQLSNQNLSTPFITKQLSKQQPVTQISNKQKYYKKLKQHNHEMIAKIKLINQALDEQVNNIQIKYLHKLSNLPASQRKHPNNKRNIIVQRKYRQLDLLKQQLESKLHQQRSLSTLTQRINQLKAVYKQKYMIMQQNHHRLKKMRKFKGKDNLLTNLTTTSSKAQSSQTHLKRQTKLQIEQLKHNIKKQTQRIYASKQQFINNNKKNRIRDKRNLSTLDIRQQNFQKQQKNCHKITQQQQLSTTAKQLKKQYEKIGKRLQHLKIQKLSLTISQGNEQRKKYLKHLHCKIQQLNKLVKK